MHRLFAVPAVVAALSILVASPSAAQVLVINNGLAPPNPANVLDTTITTPVSVENVGCDVTVESPCQLVGDPTSVSVAPGASLDVLTPRQTSGVSVSGGSVGILDPRNRASALISGGGVGMLELRDASSATLSGGAVLSVIASGVSRFTLEGGSASSIDALEGSRVTVVGTGFGIDGEAADEGPIDAASGTLTGVSKLGEVINTAFSRASGATIFLLPSELTEDAKLIASDGAAGDRFGTVAVSGDTALIGARFDDDGANTAGSAYVFRYDGMDWLEEQKLTASSAAPGEVFGSSVAIAGDTAVIGAPGVGLFGAAYVFRYDGMSWIEEAELIPDDVPAIDVVGSAVAVQGDWVVVGDGEANAGSTIDAGAAYVFRYDGAVWVEEAKLTASDAAIGDGFGESLALAGDTVLIGAPFDAAAATLSGSAYVFRNDGMGWVEEAKLTASDALERDQLGFSVALSGDTAVVGAPLSDDDGTASGSAYVFRRTGDTWVEEAKLTASDAAADAFFGIGVAVSGSTAVVGASGSDLIGAAYVFQFDGAGWVEGAKLQGADAAMLAGVGTSVALSNGTTLLGAPGDDDNGQISGSAYVFSVPEPSAFVLQAIALATLVCLARGLAVLPGRRKGR